MFLVDETQRTLVHIREDGSTGTGEAKAGAGGERVEMESLVHLTPASRHSLRPAALSLGETKGKKFFSFK